MSRVHEARTLRHSGKKTYWYSGTRAKNCYKLGTLGARSAENFWSYPINILVPISTQVLFPINSQVLGYSASPKVPTSSPVLQTW